MPKAASFWCACAVSLLVLMSPVQAKPFTDAEVYTAYWPPYVNAPDAELGTASRIVQMVYNQMELSPVWQELDYYFSYQQVVKSGINANFPYFWTAARAKEVLYSDPLMKVENGVFYSTQSQQIAPDLTNLSQLKVGRVAGYSYGEKLAFLLDDAIVFSSEVMALTALVNGEIDLLPISIEVARHLIQEYYPHRIHEFKVLPRYRSNDGIHLIAPKTPEGEAFIAKFNAALALLKEKGMIEQVLSTPKLGGGSGYVRLVLTEGFPVVTGFELTEAGEKRFYMIPQGSRAIVLGWDDVVLKPHKTEKIFDGMMNYSKVRIVNGPHAGRELHVRNMHLEVD